MSAPTPLPDLSSFLTVNDFEEQALARLPTATAGYYRSGSDSGDALSRNRAAWKSLALLPRILRNVSSISTAVTLNSGLKLPTPIAIAPTAFNLLASKCGEVGSARAAAALGALYVLSNWATTSVEGIAKGVEGVHPGGPRWLQLYVYKTRGITEKLIHRASKAGFTGLVVTTDTPVLGFRHADARNNFHLPPDMKLANFDDADMPVPKDGGSALAALVDAQMDSSLTWSDIAWIKGVAKEAGGLSVIVKGLHRADDAQLAVRAGVDGIIVSNHGGRQCGSTPGTAEMLPGVVKAVEGSGVDVFVDGGIRTGSDVVKALALGAKACFLGRPALWGLAVGGEPGVKKVLNLLQEDLVRNMALVGASSVEDLDPSLVTVPTFTPPFQSRL